MIVGAPGSGKSTFARRLGEITDLPVILMDHIHYLPGWVERAQQDKVSKAQAIHDQDRWIFEGGLAATDTARAARADRLIWLDLPLPIRFARILKRRVQFRGTTRRELPGNCPERLDPQFLAYMFRTRNTGRDQIAQMIADAPHLTVHHLRTSTGADTFLEWLQIDRAVGD